MSRNIVVLLDDDRGRVMVEGICATHGFGFDEFKELIDAQIEHNGRPRRRQLWNEFDDILDRIAEDE